MKQFTNAEQTAKLIGLGLLKPKSEVKAEQAGGCTWYNPAYSIGELIEMLPKSGGTIEYEYGEWLVDWRLHDFQAVGSELIDALYEMIVELRRRGQL